MNRESTFPFLLGAIGTCLGVSLGWGLFRIGVISDLSLSYAISGFAGAIIGYATGIFVLKAGVNKTVESFSRVSTAAVLVCIGAIFVTLGTLRQQSFLLYTGMVAFAGSIIPRGPDRGFRTAFGLAAAVVVSVIALIQTGDYSWLLLGGPALLGLASTLLLRNQPGHSGL